MTPDEIIDKWIGNPFLDDDAAVSEATREIVAGLKAAIVQAITAAVKEEREACARMAEEKGEDGEWYIKVFADSVAEDIRTRKDNGGRNDS